MKEASKAQNITMSDLVREAVARWLDKNGNPSQKISQQTVELLREQLQSKDDQIRELHQLVAISQKHSDSLMRQLEDHRQSGKWWRFWQKSGRK